MADERPAAPGATGPTTPTTPTTPATVTTVSGAVAAAAAAAASASAALRERCSDERATRGGRRRGMCVYKRMSGSRGLSCVHAAVPIAEREKQKLNE